MAAYQSQKEESGSNLASMRSDPLSKSEMFTKELELFGKIFFGLWEQHAGPKSKLINKNLQLSCSMLSTE